MGGAGSRDPTLRARPAGVPGAAPGPARAPAHRRGRLRQLHVRLVRRVRPVRFPEGSLELAAGFAIAAVDPDRRHAAAAVPWPGPRRARPRPAPAGALLPGRAGAEPHVQRGGTATGRPDRVDARDRAWRRAALA